MKKLLYILLMAGLVLGLASCTRSEIDDPEWNDPAGYYILVEGRADPAVLFIDGNIHTSQIAVRVRDSKNRPVSGATVFFEQLPDSLSHQQVEWGYFDNSAATVRKVTDQNGEARVTFFGPVRFYSGGMIIHAVLEVGGRAYRGSDSHVGSVPQDFIAITMYNSAAAPGAAR